MCKTAKWSDCIQNGEHGGVSACCDVVQVGPISTKAEQVYTEEAQHGITEEAGLRLSNSLIKGGGCRLPGDHNELHAFANAKPST